MYLVPGGVPGPRGGVGVPGSRGGVPGQVLPPTVDRMTHAYENITLPQTSFAGGKNGRVATAQGKQGIWFLLFPDRENMGNFVLTQGKIC